MRAVLQPRFKFNECLAVSTPLLATAISGSGNCSAKRAPPPGASETETVPFSTSMICRTINNSSPAPVSLLVPRQNRSKILSRSSSGTPGLPADGVADTLGLAPNTLTFHFDRLRMAGLVTARSRA
jgi:hypothetical protein